MTYKNRFSIKKTLYFVKKQVFLHRIIISICKKQNLAFNIYIITQNNFKIVFKHKFFSSASLVNLSLCCCEIIMKQFDPNSMSTNALHKHPKYEQHYTGIFVGFIGELRVC